MKKIYAAPLSSVVEVNAEQAILAGSPIKVGSEEVGASSSLTTQEGWDKCPWEEVEEEE